MQALTWNQVAAIPASPASAPPVIDGAELREQLQKRGAIAARAPHAVPHFAVGVALDDVAIRDAARTIFFCEIDGSAYRLQRILEQADARIALAIEALAAKCGLAVA